MSKIIVFANQKGGVGKTTSSLNVSGFLKEAGNSVLAVDLDPQSSLSAGLGIDIRNTGIKTMADFFLGSPPEDIICELSGISIMPSNPGLENVAKEIEREHLRKNEILKIRMSSIFNRYDFVIIDTPPGTRSVLTLNALCVADYIIIPVQLNHFSLLGVSQILQTISDVKEQLLNPDIEILGLLGTFFEKTEDCKKNLQILEDKFNGELFKTIIRKSTDLAKSPRFAKPISLYKKDSIGYKDYLRATEEILNRISINETKEVLT